MKEKNIKRYMTIGIQNEISPELQFFLWEIQINKRKEGQKFDYLQIYKLSKGSNSLQVIEHTAEEPKHHDVYYVETTNPIEGKIYIITDEYEDFLVETMLFPSER